MRDKSEFDYDADVEFKREPSPYTLIKTEIIDSIKDGNALGIYVYLMCCNDGNKLDIKGLSEHFNCDKEEIYRCLNLLNDMNYLIFKR